MRELDLPFDRWTVIFEPRHLEKLKGRVTVLGSQRKLFAAALNYLGYAANGMSETHWKQKWSKCLLPTLEGIQAAMNEGFCSATYACYAIHFLRSINEISRFF
ncbi:MAG: hypothetical protein HY935_04785 [Nitrosomonadales bacterium]|nr:hypothetical protein [Nitrosomonadales bacterium]